MSHAQRLLPMEQLLSGATPERTAVARAQTGTRPGSRESRSRRAAPRPFISPFAADSARKGTPRSEASETRSAFASRTGRGQQPASRHGIGRARRGPPLQKASPRLNRRPSPDPTPKPDQASLDDVRAAVLNALASAGQNMLASMLEAGEWQIEGNQLVIRVASSATLIDMSISADAKRMIIATASAALGRAVRLQIVPGANLQPAATQTTAPKPAANGNGGSRGRAEQEPVVQRMKEKFGAEIRTVIDYRK